MSVGTEFIANHMVRAEALRLQRSADRDTKARYHGAIPLSIVMAATKPSWASTIANGLLWRTDWTDGRKAKKGRTLWSEMPRTDVSRKDPKADKRLQYGNRFALIARACIAKDFKTASVVATESVVSIARDYRMSQDRKLAETYGIETDATNANRVKTMLLAAGGVVALSPVAEQHRAVKNAGIGALCVGTAIGVVGELTYRSTVREAIAANG